MKKIIRNILMGVYLLGAMLLVFSCNDKLDIQQVYPFTVTTMPVQKRIKIGETAEIRFQLNREGYYEETKYFIRYFQPDGKGALRMADETVFLPNDLYPLPGETFRLYYTSASTDQQQIDVYIEDSFGQVVQLTFAFNNENVKEEQKE
ncbi:DUF3872 domain-containing protein [Parabacteroides sp. Marseille-P3160]|uniref:DUF3872 domain-containing protein n=1 Tax=Parabacteroides sp. Marseille-P3160 TaxID=1917887 RepID=UPI0009BAC687|nr:DUF3872 domain-containing protein [Parabacteroides sp. Marseille-P3160]MDD3915024.1 DUF3872 domain-containing protein [Bacteroidales bacterium]